MMDQQQNARNEIDQLLKKLIEDGKKAVENAWRIDDELLGPRPEKESSDEEKKKPMGWLGAVIIALEQVAEQRVSILFTQSKLIEAIEEQDKILENKMKT